MIGLSQTLLDSLAAFSLVALAEVGDKSQLVCMGLAARYRGLPVLLGAILAFALLNLIAVAFGIGLAHWLPAWLVASVVAVLFISFGLRAWFAQDEETQADLPPKSYRNILLSTLALTFVAEFGDKTQLAVAGLAGTLPPISIWIGATAGLALTTVVSVVAGRTVLQKLPLGWIQRLSAVLFLSFGVIAFHHAITSFG